MVVEFLNQIRTDAEDLWHTWSKNFFRNALSMGDYKLAMGLN